MNTVQKTSNYHLYWYDSEKTILVLDLYARWTWSDVNKAIKQANVVTAEQTKHNRVYAIGTISASGSIVPKNVNGISQILELIRNDPAHEEFMIYVMKHGLLRQLINLTIDMYQQVVGDKRYLFADTMEEALQIIHEHKSDLTSTS